MTDTREGGVYKLAGESSGLAPGHVFTSSNGIALSPDETTLFVASFGDGISTVDLTSQSARPLPHSPDVCLGYIDGLYAIKGGLIAIQNGPMIPRIVRFALTSDSRRIAGMKILERRNPLSAIDLQSR